MVQKSEQRIHSHLRRLGSRYCYLLQKEYAKYGYNIDITLDITYNTCLIDKSIAVKK